MKTTRRTFIQTIGAVLAGLGLGVKVAAEPKSNMVRFEPGVEPRKGIDPWEGQRHRAGLSANPPWKARYNPDSNTIEFNGELDASTPKG